MFIKIFHHGLRGLTEDPFDHAREMAEKVLERSAPRLSREGPLRLTYTPRCLIDALYLHVLNGHLKHGLSWRRCRGCGREFLPKGREKYCTRQCKSRSNQRAYLARMREAGPGTPG